MKQPAPRFSTDRQTHFYLASAVAGLLVVLVGFNLTYLQPVAAQRYDGPWWGHIHGALALGWVLLTIVQAWLAPRKLIVHRRLGIAALLVLPAWFGSTVLIARESARIRVAAGEIAMAQDSFLGSLVSPFIVLVLVGLALYFRKQPQAHKRLIYVATVLMLWPAWQRWRNYFADPDSLMNFFGFVVAMLPIPLAMIRDKLKFGAVHPALLWAGLFVLAEQSFEVAFAFTPGWNSVSKALFDILV